MFLKEESIIIQYSILGTTQQNSMAERKNTILIDMVRGIINTLNIILSLWSEVLKTMVYVLNRVLLNIIRETLLELWK